MTCISYKKCDICDEKIAFNARSYAMLQIYGEVSDHHNQVDMCEHCLQLTLRLKQSIFRKGQMDIVTAQGVLDWINNLLEATDDRLLSSMYLSTRFIVEEAIKAIKAKGDDNATKATNVC